jgi:plastocyanin
VSRRILLIASLLVLFGTGASNALADNSLVGMVGANDAYVIALADSSGNPVTSLQPGTYTLVVHDQSALHDFHLFGPGVDVATPVDKTGDFTFTVTLTDGKYTYQCDPHFTRMHGSFTVGAIPTPTPPPPKPAAKILVRMATGGHAAVRGTLAAGRATFVVTDSSAKDNVRLTGPGVSRATGLRFRGTVTWKVTLKPGRYVLRSDAHKALARTFVVR